MDSNGGVQMQTKQSAKFGLFFGGSMQRSNGKKMVVLDDAH